MSGAIHRPTHTDRCPGRRSSLTRNAPACYPTLSALGRPGAFFSAFALLLREYFKDIRLVFAVVKTGGKQYKVRVGETLDVEKLAVEAGTQVRLDQVLLAASDENVAYGRPMIDGAVVTARVVRQYKGPKLIIFRYKSKSRYRRRTGHRQQLTQLMVQTIDIPGLGTDTMAVRRRPVVESSPVSEPASPAPVAPSASTGSAAPSDDVLPAIAPTAQLDTADTAAATPAYEALGDTTLPTTTLPPQTAPVEMPADHLSDTDSV